MDCANRHGANTVTLNDRDISPLSTASGLICFDKKRLRCNSGDQIFGYTQLLQQLNYPTYETISFEQLSVKLLSIALATKWLRILSILLNDNCQSNKLYSQHVTNVCSFLKEKSVSKGLNEEDANRLICFDKKRPRCNRDGQIFGYTQLLQQLNYPTYETISFEQLSLKLFLSIGLAINTT